MVELHSNDVFFLGRDEFYQMFIYGIEADSPIVLMLMRDELGRALKEAVQEKCPNLPSHFILLHQGRKVIKLRLLVVCEAVDSLPNAARGVRARERGNFSFATKIITHLKERLNNVLFFLPYGFCWPITDICRAHS